MIMIKTRGADLPVLPVSDIPLRGNQENVLAAITASHVLGVSLTGIAEAIRPFRSLPHRLEYVGTYKGIQFFNDSLATIPEATMHAVEALGGSVATLLVGGFDRHLDFSSLGAYLRAHPVQNLILFPDTGKRIWDAIGVPSNSSIMQAFPVATMEEAVRLAYQVTPKGKICLLSPASASYNMFKDYADRGEQFTKWVEVLGRK